MKPSFYSILLIGVLFIITSCNRSESLNSTIISSTREIATSGNWKVSLFSEQGNNETTDFTGYTFTFNPNGSLSVVNSGVTTNGTWNTSAGSNSAKFNIDLGPKTAANKPLGELTDDWKILSSTNTEIRLMDDNATSNEFLTFSKN